MPALLPKDFKGIKVFDRKIFHSDIGFFFNTYKKNDVNSAFVQDSISFSIHAGTIRGMHFQLPPHSQAKIINVLQGKIVDFFVDLRRDSDTYLSYGSIEISSDDPTSLYIPKGFAHGFITMTPNTIVAYKLDHDYYPDMEETLLWNDKQIDIKWPKMKKYFQSDKDINGKSLEDIISLLEKV